MHGTPGPRSSVRQFPTGVSSAQRQHRVPAQPGSPRTPVKIVHFAPTPCGLRARRSEPARGKTPTGWRIQSAVPERTDRGSTSGATPAAQAWTRLPLPRVPHPLPRALPRSSRLRAATNYQEVALGDAWLCCCPVRWIRSTATSFDRRTSPGGVLALRCGPHTRDARSSRCPSGCMGRDRWDLGMVCVFAGRTESCSSGGWTTVTQPACLVLVFASRTWRRQFPTTPVATLAD